MRGNAVAVARWLGKYVPFLVVGVLVVGYERLASPEYKLSAIFGQFEGNTESQALRAQVDGLTVRLAAEKAAEEKLQTDVASYKQKLDIEQQNAINAYKLTLDSQLESYKNQLNLAAQKAVDTNRLNLERRNKMTEQLIAPIMEGMKTRWTMAAVGMGGDVSGYSETINSIIQLVTMQTRDALAKVEVEEAQRAALLDDFQCTTARLKILQQASTSESNTGATPQAEQHEAAVAPATPPHWARVGAKSPQLLVRSAPQKDGSSVVCVLSAGAVVQIVGQTERDPAHNITFVQASFNRQGAGPTTGWISQWSLEDVSAPSAGDAPQPCEAPRQ